MDETKESIEYDIYILNQRKNQYNALKIELNKKYEPLQQLLQELNKAIQLIDDGYSGTSTNMIQAKQNIVFLKKETENKLQTLNNMCNQISYDTANVDRQLQERNYTLSNLSANENWLQ